MKKYIPVMIASGVLLLSFQNCAQNQAEILSPSSGISQNKIEDPVLSQAQSIDILTQNDQKISLSLETGELVQDERGNIVKKCLPDSIRAEILDLLANSNLCETPEPGPEVACAQVYSAPYSEIHWSDKSIKVGEAVSSCHKDLDLCGQDGMLLRGLLKDVVARWSEWSCDFKVVSR